MSIASQERHALFGKDHMVKPVLNAEETPTKIGTYANSGQDWFVPPLKNLTRSPIGSGKRFAKDHI